jgi:hypothetical protein
LALLTGVAGAQSLGAIARKQREQKKKPATTSRVFTNDDLTTPTDYNNGAASTGAAATEKSAESPDAKAADTKAATPEDKAKLIAEWRAKIDDQKKAATLLERELDVLQREYKMRIAVYYADAGARLRNQGQWAQEDAKYQADIAAKQKDAVAARQKVDELREQARKAGVPSGQIE